MSYSSRRYRSRSSEGTGLIFLFIIGCIEFAYYYKQVTRVAPYIIGVLFALILALVASRIHKRKLSRRQSRTLEYADSLNGLQFEHYVVSLLKRHDFKKVKLTEKYDMGVDIVAEKNGERWGIQTKRYNGLVKAEAVRQVIAGLNSYNCDKAMVITNSTYSKYAIKLARSNHCILIDRMELAKLITDTKESVAQTA